MPRLLKAFAVVFFCAICGILHAADFVWWEGEGSLETNFPEKSWFAASTFQAKRDEVLSEGDWLANSGKRTGPEAFARYRITVPAEGQYSFWCRKFWKHGPFRWRFDDEDWSTCGRDIGLADSVDIRKHLCVNWVYLGKVRLTKGVHTFELRLLAEPGQNLTACFDCFLLTPYVFSPRGKLKPGEKSGKAEPGWWAFEPSPDPFKEAMLDLRHLNEKVAGQSGFVRRKGADFLLGDGRPVKFWGVNVGAGIVQLGHEPHEYLARRLAKVGVNLVRIHAPIFEVNAPDPTTVNSKYLDNLHHLIAALKGQGIYVDLSFHFPLWFNVKPTYGIDGYEGIGNKRPFALLFFDERMQEIYHSWARKLLLAKNPYTGVPLAKDPAVAIVEIVNEDSYFFWTFSRKNIPEIQIAKLEKFFGGWLRKKYGSIQKAPAAWGGPARQKHDAPGRGRMQLLDAWHMTAKGRGQGSKARRMSDQLQFLTEHQHGFYKDMVRFLRAEIGSRSLISASNWHTADPRILDGLERYTYTAGDLIDRHGYFGPRHKGPRSRYAVDVGDVYSDRAGVLEPDRLPIQVNQVDGFPQIISEIGWPNPNRFKAEFPFLCATYGSLQGTDGHFLFAVGTGGWETSVRKFPLSVPSILGQFPAAALMYRRGDLSQAKPVVHEVLDLDALYDFKGSAVRTPQNLDELRRADVPPGGARTGKEISSFDPLSFYVGPVLRSFGTDKSKALVRDITDHIDRDAKTIRSLTGELLWNYGTGLVTVNTPRTQGATGFLAKAGRLDLADVVIESNNEFGTVLVTSLDGKPLASSTKILIQIMTEEKPFGWQVQGDRITNLGGYPLNVRNIDTVVTLKKSRLGKVSTLDEHGYLRRTVKTSRSGPGLTTKLAPDAIYTILH